MEALLLAVNGLAGLLAGISGGLRWGKSLRDRSEARYWLANAAVMLGGTLVVFVSFYAGQRWLAGAGIGVMAGGITGLKYGLGKTVGLWRTVDRITGTDDLPRE